MAAERPARVPGLDVTGFEGASTAALRTIRSNLLDGLDAVAGHLAAGTFDTCGPRGAAPPSQSGRLTLALLAGVTAELADRERESWHVRQGLAETPAA
ncbi:hypothetical protein [Phytohabitans houttuyneae]|uniref:Uncharacterized protein n=1 Tax=Phytohabitans houttuyneae TaxID=1076126 RepID=A0A6V8K2P6_9ACTN|nr:hypothetical protein [Phytohabitans houttuyneae]GFJ79403.1 hypothetical protein Phou_035830 [Phytohabitans houttuyneae]